MSNTRTERDTMGEMQVPADALYGASTARAVENFPIAHQPVPADVVHAFGYLKAACADANRQLGKLDDKRAEVIIAAAMEVAEGKHDDHFPVDVPCHRQRRGAPDPLPRGRDEARLSLQSIHEVPPVLPGYSTSPGGM